jgi:hypothetical protein
MGTASELTVVVPLDELREAPTHLLDFEFFWELEA